MVTPGHSAQGTKCRPLFRPQENQYDKMWKNTTGHAATSGNTSSISETVTFVPYEYYKHAHQPGKNLAYEQRSRERKTKWCPVLYLDEGCNSDYFFFFQTKVDTSTKALLFILFGVTALAPVTNVSYTAYTNIFLPTALTKLSVLMTESMCITSFVLG